MVRTPVWFEEIDRALATWLARHSIPLMRVAIGVVFFWFGALKLIPGLSPADSLIRQSVPFVPMELFIPFLAIWEMVIGLGFISGRWMRFTILILLPQMVGTMLPVFVRPDLVFTIFPFALTLEGQYIVKNLVLVTAALVIGATVRGGRIVTEAQNT